MLDAEDAPNISPQMFHYNLPHHLKKKHTSQQ